MAGFTPGPWAAHGKGWEVRACDGQMKVCDIRGWGFLTGGGARNLPEAEAIAIQKANEALIAAAPDLFHALQMCVIERSEWLDEARAAIAKARGEV